MHREEQAFLDEIFKDKTSTSALVFADWLEEREDTRSDNIRWWVGFCSKAQKFTQWNQVVHWETIERFSIRKAPKEIRPLACVLLHKLTTERFETQKYIKSQSLTQINKVRHLIEWQALGFLTHPEDHIQTLNEVIAEKAFREQEQSARAITWAIRCYYSESKSIRAALESIARTSRMTFDFQSVYSAAFSILEELSHTNVLSI